MAEKSVPKRVGGIRPSQMMFTYGVGATVDLPHFSVIVAGLDDWDQTSQSVIVEERLLSALRLDPNVGSQITQLRGAPWEPETRNPFDPWAFTGIPVIPFPRWLRCSNPGCNLLSSIDSRLFNLELLHAKPHLARYVHQCSGKSIAMPARVIIACPDGHLDEFPWVEFCHKGGECSGSPLLELRDISDGTRSTSMEVSCRTCLAKAYLNEAFGQNADNVLPQCRGRMPHLRRLDGGCTNQAVALLLGASNAWWPVSRSVLSIPDGANRLSQLVAEHFGKLQNITVREQVTSMLSMADELRELTGYDPGDVWQAIEVRRNSVTQGDASLDLLGPEWTQFTNPDDAPSSPDFLLKSVGSPRGFDLLVAPTVLAERLRVVFALTGFTRLDGPDSLGEKGGAVRTVGLTKRRPMWLPSAEARGEGLFIRLPEEVVSAWEQRVAGTPRLEALRTAQQRWRQRRDLDPAVGWPGERFVLLHSFSHALINAFALECGYAAASIRERLYSRESGGPNKPMAGFLLYTSAPDAEGTLGGLVALGDDQLLGRLMSRALERLELCSTDPMCADHLPGLDDDTLHGASCHACLFLPETCCEVGNRLLDRSVLIPTLASAGIEYFSSAR
jgi:hypothetical protein